MQRKDELMLPFQILDIRCQLSKLFLETLGLHSLLAGTVSLYWYRVRVVVFGW